MVPMLHGDGTTDRRSRGVARGRTDLLGPFPESDGGAASPSAAPPHVPRQVAVR